MKYKKNHREKAVQCRMIDAGYEVFSKGWPDFLCVNESGDIVAIEVKRKQKRSTAKMGLSIHQARVIEILRQVGLKVVIEYID